MMCAMSNQTMTLEPFSRAALATVEPWFRDPQTSRFLGGPEWPVQMLQLDERRVAGEEFRGARHTGAYRYLACLGGVPVGYVDCGTFDRWTICAQDPRGIVVADAIDVPAGSIAFVTAPDYRRQGLGRAMIAALVRRPELGAVELFGAGVESENVASARCLRAAGFRLQAEQPDFEGMLYYVAGRDLARP
jgi:RimJ/RimL family protein N-acetyltransferase